MKCSEEVFYSFKFLSTVRCKLHNAKSSILSTVRFRASLHGCPYRGAGTPPWIRIRIRFALTPFLIKLRALDASAHGFDGVGHQIQHVVRPFDRQNKQ